MYRQASERASLAAAAGAGVNIGCLGSWMVQGLGFPIVEPEPGHGAHRDGGSKVCSSRAFSSRIDTDHPGALGSVLIEVDGLLWL